jgi:hypothetical protein
MIPRKSIAALGHEDPALADGEVWAGAVGIG